MHSVGLLMVLCDRWACGWHLTLSDSERPCFPLDPRSHLDFCLCVSFSLSKVSFPDTNKKSSLVYLNPLSQSLGDFNPFLFKVVLGRPEGKRPYSCHCLIPLALSFFSLFLLVSLCVLSLWFVFGPVTLFRVSSTGKNLCFMPLDLQNSFSTALNPKHSIRTAFLNFYLFLFFSQILWS